VYTNGATRYNLQDLTQAGAATMYSGTGLAGAYQSVGFGIAPDSVFANGTQQQLIQTWGMRGAFNHNWNPYWSSSLYGAFASVHYNGAAKLLICGNGVVGGSIQGALNPAGSGTAITVCNPDYNVGQLGFITRWTPVKNLTFSADLTWIHLDQRYAGFFEAVSTALAKPATDYELKNQDTVLLLFRAQRNW